MIPHAFTRIESTRVGHFDMKFVICCDRLVLVDKKEESIEYSDVANRKCKSEWLSWLQRNQTPYLQVLRVSQLVLCCCVSVTLFMAKEKKNRFYRPIRLWLVALYVWAVWQCVGETPKSKKQNKSKLDFDFLVLRMFPTFHSFFENLETFMTLMGVCLSWWNRYGTVKLDWIMRR